MQKITDGYGNEIEGQKALEFLANEIFKYRDFETAAPMIRPNWERHHLHKEIQLGRVYRSEILVIYDDQRYTAFSQHKKMFISLEEIERIREYVKDRPERKHNRCEWCKRVERYCIDKPCPERIKRSPDTQRAIQVTAERVAEYLKKTERGSSTFRRFDRQGNPKRLKHS